MCIMLVPVCGTLVLHVYTVFSPMALASQNLQDMIIVASPRTQFSPHICFAFVRSSICLSWELPGWLKFVMASIGNTLKTNAHQPPQDIIRYPTLRNSEAHYYYSVATSPLPSANFQIALNCTLRPPLSGAPVPTLALLSSPSEAIETEDCTV